MLSNGHWVIEEIGVEGISKFLEFDENQNTSICGIWERKFKEGIYL
jgi:hypothetical protein